MGKAIFDILRDEGASWIKCTGDFTKRVSDDGAQVYISLSPNGDKIATYICATYYELPSEDFFKLSNIPSGLDIPYSVSRDVIVEKMQSFQPNIQSDDVFEIRNRIGNKRIALALVPFSRVLAIYGVENGKDQFVRILLTFS